LFNLYQQIFDKYAYEATPDVDYQYFMNAREKLLRTSHWFLNGPEKNFSMKIQEEKMLSFNSSQPFFNKILLENILNPLFKAMHTGQLTQLYDPMAEILSEYEFESLEFSDISPFDSDELMMGMNLVPYPSNPQTKATATHTFWYNYMPIKIKLSTNNIKPFHPQYNKIYPLYNPYVFDFLNHNFETFFPLDNLFIARKDLYKYFTYSFNIFTLHPYSLIKHNMYVFINRFYRYTALLFYDFLKKENDPYLSYYKLIRKNQNFSNTYKYILIFPIFKNKHL
jgi:hypothetical protein